MVEIETTHARWGIIGRIWSMLLVQRLVGLAGLVMILLGYRLILNTSDMLQSVDVEAVTRQAVDGMVLVGCGGVIEVLVLLGWARR